MRNLSVTLLEELALGEFPDVAGRLRRYNRARLPAGNHPSNVVRPRCRERAVRSIGRTCFGKHVLLKELAQGEFPTNRGPYGPRFALVRVLARNAPAFPVDISFRS